MKLRRGMGLTARIGLVAIVLTGLTTAPINAAERGLAISPFYSEISLKATDQTVPYTVTLSNYSDTDQAFKLSVVDFGSLDEEGGVAFLGQAAHELEHKYGLAAWMTLEQPDVTVAAGKSVNVTTVIQNRDNLAPGGHYGAVLATALTDGAAGEKQPRVGIKQVLSSLILLAKAGDSRISLRVVSQTTDALWWRLPTKVEHRFENQGNVHGVPRGTVQIIDPVGKVVRRGAINEGSGAVLPGSFRKYRAALNTLAPAWLPGPYRVVTEYRADGSDDIKRQESHFWYAGALVLWVVSLGGFILAGLLGWWLRRSLQRRLGRHTMSA